MKCQLRKTINKMEKGISIILCCYNSESRLPTTLEYLAKQEVKKDISVELIIVNNASTDRTKEIALSEWEKYHTGFLFRIVDEETPGLMFARQKGIQESQYEYVLFCDDDNWLQSDYLQRAFDFMVSNDRIGALAGKGIEVSDIDFPEWFADFKTSWAVGELYDSGNVSKKGWIWGAGMITRKNILTKALDEKYPFLNKGRTGNMLTSGDDCEICKRILLLGYELHYEKSLLFYHYLPSNRLTWAYKKRLFEGIESSNVILEKYSEVINELNISGFEKVKDFFKYILLALVSSKRMYITKLNMKAGLMLKSEKIVKDMEYKSIIKFALRK